MVLVGLPWEICRLRLLYIVPYAPTPIRTRPYHLLKQLSRNGHTITLATLYSDDAEQAALAPWRAAGIQVLAASLSRPQTLRNVASALPSDAPLQAAYCWQPQLMQRILDEMTHAPFDVIHIEHLRGAWYGLQAKQLAAQTKNAAPIVWDSVDCITHLFKQAAHDSASLKSRLITSVELGRTSRYEARLVSEFARTLVVSEGERTAFCDLLASVQDNSNCDRVCVVPNGVDVDYFAPSADMREPATILFSGKMSYHANVTAALYLLDEVMPLVWQTIPHARVQIVGQNPPGSLVRRAGARIEVTGYVPDVRPYLHHATVSCAPIRYGAGTQNKVLEAMACGTAVVATPQAISALTTKPGQDVLIGQDAAELSDLLVNVLSNAPRRKQLEQNGRRFVETTHRWGHSVSVLESIYAQAIQDAARAGEMSDVHHQC